MYHKLKKYLHNTLWIMGDKIANLVVGFFLAVVMARYLGPEDFGLFSYAISVAALFKAAGHMGLSGLIVKELVANPSDRGVTLGTTLALKFIGMAAGYIVLLCYTFFYEEVGTVEFWVLVIAGAVLLLNPFDVVDFWFQALVRSKYVTCAKLVGLAVGAVLKLIFVLLGLNVVYLVTTNLIQAVVIVLGLLIAYKITSSLSLLSWSFSKSKAKELFSQGWLIYLGSIFAVVNLKVDQIMLRWIEGPEAVGVYAVAAQVSEAWYFVPTAIVASFFPKLIKLKDDDSNKFYFRLQQLFDLLFVFALGIALVMTFLSGWLVELFFGSHYIDSASVLAIHIWAGIFVFMRAAFSKWILIENALVFSLITQGLGALANVTMNYFLIPKFGVQGAAYATLISYAFSSFFSLLVCSRTRPVFHMMLKSFFILFRCKNLKGLK